MSETSNGVTKEVCVDKAENGFVIRINKYGEKDGKYFDESKLYISSTNPLDKKSDTPSEQPFATREAVYAAIDNL